MLPAPRAIGAGPPKFMHTNISASVLNFMPVLVQCMSLLLAETDMPTAMRAVRSRGQSRKHILAVSLSGFDPEPTLRPWHSGMRSAEEPHAPPALRGRRVEPPSFFYSTMRRGESAKERCYRRSRELDAQGLKHAARHADCDERPLSPSPNPPANSPPPSAWRASGHW